MHMSLTVNHLLRCLLVWAPDNVALNVLHCEAGHVYIAAHIQDITHIRQDLQEIQQGTRRRYAEGNSSSAARTPDAYVIRTRHGDPARVAALPIANALS